LLLGKAYDALPANGALIVAGAISDNFGPIDRRIERPVETRTRWTVKNLVKMATLTWGVVHRYRTVTPQRRRKVQGSGNIDESGRERHERPLKISHRGRCPPQQPAWREKR
jgi:hypothetical protein